MNTNRDTGFWDTPITLRSLTVIIIIVSITIGIIELIKHHG